VGCETCHGRVDQMPLVWQAARLQMGWCLECHRNPEKFIRPREYVFVAEIPKSPVGKILRRKLVAGEYDPPGTPDTPTN